MGGLALKVLGPIVLLLAVAGWGKIGWSHYHSEEGKLRGLVAVVAEVDGQPKLKVKDAPAAVRNIGAARDAYRDRWLKARDALADQTARVVAMGEETARLRAEADRAAELARKLTAQRDGWMRKAAAASTRTQRLSFEEEAKQCEEAMDALYSAGF